MSARFGWATFAAGPYVLLTLVSPMSIPSLSNSPWMRGAPWIPFFQKWPELKRSAEAIYRREQANYRNEIRKLWGEGQPKLSQHAAWTVLWQRGKSPEAIQIYHLKTTGKNVSMTNIQMRVHAFAKSAGLTLRAAKAGPAVRI